MKKIVGVRFRPAGKMYYFDPAEFEIKNGDNVIVETSRGVEFGEVVQGIREVPESSVKKPLKGVLRLATEEDTVRHKENKEREKEAYSICCEKIEKHGLDMKLVEVEYAFDRSKLLFYFTADGRVDFRELVKDLASVFRTRIELRQIGVRDESKTLGSIGICGRGLCCAQFLNEFVPVSIKMAKEQGLSLNPTKISGVCGRLMCCLKYEQDTYEALIDESPRAGAKVVTPDGAGTVTNVALLRGKVMVRLGDSDDMKIKEYDVSEVEPYSKDAAEQATHGAVTELPDTLEDSEAGKRPQKKRGRHRRQDNAVQVEQTGKDTAPDRGVPEMRDENKKTYRKKVRRRPPRRPHPSDE